MPLFCKIFNLFFKSRYTDLLSFAHSNYLYVLEDTKNKKYSL